MARHDEQGHDCCLLFADDGRRVGQLFTECREACPGGVVLAAAQRSDRGHLLLRQ